MDVRVTLTEEILGSANKNPDLHREHLAKKSGDAEKEAEEMASLPVDVLEQKAITVFHREKDGTPMLYDYQVKGFLKETLSILFPILTDEEAALAKKLKIYATRCRGYVDNYVHVFPRRIKLEGAVLGPICVRPLRVITYLGDRVSLASSETMPVGTTLTCKIVCDMPLFESLLRRCLDRGQLKGLGQWRNSGKGRFDWECLDKVG